MSGEQKRNDDMTISTTSFTFSSIDSSPMLPSGRSSNTAGAVVLDPVAVLATRTFRQRLRIFYDLVSPGETSGEGWKEREEEIFKKYSDVHSSFTGGSLKGKTWSEKESVLRGKLIRKYGSEVSFEVFSYSQHKHLLTNKGGVAFRAAAIYDDDTERAVLRISDVVDDWVDPYESERGGGKGIERRNPRTKYFDSVFALRSEEGLFWDESDRDRQDSINNKLGKFKDGVHNCRSLLPSDDPFFLPPPAVGSEGEKRKEKRPKVVVSANPLRDLMGNLLNPNSNSSSNSSSNSNSNSNNTAAAENNNSNKRRRQQRKKKPKTSVLRNSTITTIPPSTSTTCLIPSSNLPPIRQLVRILVRLTTSLYSYVVGSLITIDKHWNTLLDSDWVECAWCRDSGARRWRKGSEGYRNADKLRGRKMPFARKFRRENEAKAEEIWEDVREEEGGAMFIRGGSIVMICRERGNDETIK